MEQINKFIDGEHLKIDLGAGTSTDGEFQAAGYLLQDIQPLPGIGLVCNIEELDKYIREGQCNTIRLSHVLEHFPTAKIPILLKMFHALLEEGGELEVHVPNFRWHASLLLFDQEKEAINYAFGGQKDEFDFHKTGFTPLILYNALVEAGFTVDKAKFAIEASIHAIGTK